jgi:hypothetical protein
MKIRYRNQPTNHVITQEVVRAVLSNAKKQISRVYIVQFSYSYGDKQIIL